MLYASDLLNVDVEFERLHDFLVPLSFPPLTGTRPNPVGNYSTDLAIPKVSARGFYLDSILCEFNPATVAQSGINFYTMSAFAVDTSGGVTAITLTGTTNTQAFTTTGLFKPLVLGVNKVFNNTISMIELSIVGSGAPGTFYFTASLAYRPIL
jgi:hypothetical protein